MPRTLTVTLCWWIQKLLAGLLRATPTPGEPPLLCQPHQLLRQKPEPHLLPLSCLSFSPPPASPGRTAFPPGFISLPNIFSVTPWYISPLRRDFIFNSTSAFPSHLAYHGLSHLASCLPAEIPDFPRSWCTSRTRRAQLGDVSRKHAGLRP